MAKPCGFQCTTAGSPSTAASWRRRPRDACAATRNSNEVVMPHSMVDEAVAQEAVDPATLMAENASLRDRLLRGLADAENTRRRAERTAEEAQQYAISDFARELLAVPDNLQRTIAAADDHAAETVEDAALIEGV